MRTQNVYDLLLTNLLFQELVAAKGRDLNDPSIPSLSLQSGRSYAVTVGFLPLEDLELSVGLGPLPILIHQGPGDVQYPGRGPLGREMGKLMRETRVPRAVKVADLETLLSMDLMMTEGEVESSMGFLSLTLQAWINNPRPSRVLGVAIVREMSRWTDVLTWEPEWEYEVNKLVVYPKRLYSWERTK